MKTHYIRNPTIQAQQQQQHYKRPTKLDLNRLTKFIKPIIMAFEEFLNSLQQEGGRGGSDVLTKVGVFVLVQALVYLILTKSSNIFSGCSSSSSSSMLRSLSFRPVRMSSVRRVLTSLSDFPAGSDDPSSANPTD